MINKEKEFYVYQLRVENEVLPFYIGKGTGNRLNAHFSPSNLKYRSYKNNKIKNCISNNVTILREKLYVSTCELSCFEMEMYLIEMYGRKDSNTGILCNHSNFGIIHTCKGKSKQEIERVKLLGLSRKGISKTEEAIKRQMESRKITLNNHYKNVANIIVDQIRSKNSIKVYCDDNNIIVGVFHQWKQNERITSIVNDLLGYKLTNKSFSKDQRINIVNDYIKSKKSMLAYCNDINIDKNNLIRWSKMYNINLPERTTSLYNGVTFVSNRNKYRVSLNVNKVKYNLGEYENEIEAAKVYDQAIIKYNGDIKKLNFK